MASAWEGSKLVCRSCTFCGTPEAGLWTVLEREPQCPCHLGDVPRPWELLEVKAWFEFEGRKCRNKYLCVVYVSH